MSGRVLISDKFVQRTTWILMLVMNLHRVPTNIRNRSQFSNKTMDTTIGCCLKTIGCTRKSGFLFAGTCCMINDERV